MFTGSQHFVPLEHLYGRSNSGKIHKDRKANSNGASLSARLDEGQGL